MISLQTLGSVDLRDGGKSLATILAQPKRLALLAYLACARPAGFRSRDTLLALFWPEADAERARNNLRQALHHLRRGLGEETISTRGERDVGINADALGCDAVQFSAAVAAGHHEEALALYRGDFLPGLHVQDAPEAERWIDDERLHLRRTALECAGTLAATASARGEAAAAVRWARRAASIDPTDETAARRLLELLAQAGDLSGAMDTYAEFARRLDAELGLKPSAETTRLVRTLSERQQSTSAEVKAITVPRPRVPGESASRAQPEVAPALAEAAPRDGEVAETAPAVPAPRASSETAPGWGGAVTLLTILGLLTALLIPLIASRTRREAAPHAAPPSVGVLPFVNMSGDPSNDFLSDGLTEELLHRLAQVPELHVAARTSSFAYKGKNLPVDSIGRALRVGHLLEGSVRQSGARLRVTAQLIDARSGYHVWSESYETRLDDMVAVQDSIGSAIVGRLVVAVAGQRGHGSHGPRDGDAYVAAMKGWRAFRLNRPEAYAAAARHFGDAIRRDPGYGYAYAGLATVRLWQGYLRWADTDSSYAEARELAARALALDSALVDGYLVLGRVSEVRDQRDADAEGLYRRAMRVAPSDPRPYSRLAPILARRGLADDAVAMAERAVALDPASPAVYSDLANVLVVLERYPDAERALRQALALDPGHPILLGNLAVQLVQQRKYASAESVIVDVRARSPKDPLPLARHAFILAKLGRASAARALADSAERAGVSPVELATTYLALGDTAAVYAQLERALARGDDRLDFLRDTTTFAPLRGTERFRRLLEGVAAGQDRR